MLNNVVEALGWIGALTSFAAYLLFSLNRISNGYVLQAAFLGGGIFMAINGIYHDAWPSAITNLAWCSIASLALVRLARRVPVTLAQPQEYPHDLLLLPTADTPLCTCTQKNYEDMDGAQESSQ